jgi:glycosyltransferase involved in cell wall biosynthesis
MASIFYTKMKSKLEEYLALERAKVGNDVLKIDLHCHDFNSSVPDETLGRILGVPETWLPTKDLLKTLEQSGTSAVTITNHNNARSCFDLLDKGHDVLVGAEFSCTVPDLDIGIHVLTYGFTSQEEIRLNSLRHNLYKFLAFTKERDLPTIWAHPLNFFAPTGAPDPSKLDKLLLCFERFEGVNGQRNSWQNLLTIDWIQRATPEKIDAIARREGLSSTEFCRMPYDKRIAGGSDDHFGVFAGTTGTYVRIPNLSVRLKERQRSDLVLEALRNGDFAPYGGWNDGEKLSLALLDYVTSLALNMEDPGLGRILLHKGKASDKVAAIAVSNAIYELRRHKFTMRFLRDFHAALRGQRPNLLSRFLLRRRYPRFLALAESFAVGPQRVRLEGHSKELLNVHFLFRAFAELAVERVADHLKKFENGAVASHRGIEEFLSSFEMPSVFRELLGAEASTVSRSKRYRKSRLSLASSVDALSFPVIASGIVFAAAFASAKVMHKEREFLMRLAKDSPDLKPPQRVLWLTDTMGDKNGVSGVLSQVLRHAETFNLPIDILACHPTMESAPHFYAVKPLREFSLALYPQQPFRVPDLLEIQTLFEEGSYTQVICSTEGPMLLTALFLKHAHNVPVHFFVHTDWLAFCRDSLRLSEPQCDRVRRFLRGVYRQFDTLFVLNSEQKALFCGNEFQIPKQRVHQTAHWAEPTFRQLPSAPLGVDDPPVLIFAGRLSAEKGVFELPDIFAAARATNPSVRIRIAGTGPAEPELRRAMPDAEFLGWQSADELCVAFNQASLLLLPSRFDTFGCVVLEAMACGLPVAAYRNKGPADIIIHEESGYLSENSLEMAIQVSRFVANPKNFIPMRKAAIARAGQYSPSVIMRDLLLAIGVQ